MKRRSKPKRADGLWVLRTNAVYETETVAHIYKTLWTVDQSFRTAKSVLETRPIYHQSDEAVRGHVFCGFLALTLKAEFERRWKAVNAACEWAQVLRGLEGLQEVELTYQGRRFLLRSQLNGEASAALRGDRDKTGARRGRWLGLAAAARRLTHAYVPG
jgi:hypothetical protein